MSSKDAENTDEITLEYTLDAPVERVWRALATPELAAAWLDLPADLDSPIHFEILDARPLTSIRYLWHDEAAHPNDTVVTFDLVPLDAERTRFRLTHSAKTVPKADNSNWQPHAMAA